MNDKISYIIYDIVSYILFTLHRIKEYILGFRSKTRKETFWVDIFTGIFLSFVFGYWLTKWNALMQMMFISGFILISFVIYKDHSSGGHKKWRRDQYGDKDNNNRKQGN